MLDRRLLVLSGMAVLITGVGGHLAASEQQFDVASIRPMDANTPIGKRQLGPVVFYCQATLKDLIRLAYDFEGYQVIGGPKWIESEMYEVRAKAASPTSDVQMRAMLRDLLVSRFRLAVHHETREMAVYVLVVAPKGTKLNPAKEGTPRDGRGAIQVSSSDVIGRGASTRLIARYLTMELGRPVLNETGLDGSYDFQVGFGETRTEEAPGEAFGTLEYALKDIGLKLQAKKRPVRVVLVDAATRPSGN